MNRMFCIFLFIFCEVANLFLAVGKICVVKGIVLEVEDLNIINLNAIYYPVTGPEQPVYVVLCLQYESKKGAKIRNRDNQAPYLTRMPNGKVTIIQFNTTNERQEVGPFPAGDHKAAMSRS